MYLALCTTSGNLVSGVYNANTVLVENQHILCHLGRSPAISTSIREGSIHNIIILYIHSIHTDHILHTYVTIQALS